SPRCQPLLTAGLDAGPPAETKDNPGKADFKAAQPGILAPAGPREGRRRQLGRGGAAVVAAH
ncbi:MAG: hypothetical protein M5U09_27950, partial [Gammaproteobacteria bacterium]|nr:hypothetical protein [Gammaproteobacteria bacterium]